MFKHLPPELRNAAMKMHAGKEALKFPAGYAMKLKSKSAVLVNPPDEHGMVIMLHDKSFIMIEFIEWLKKHNIEHEIIAIASS